MYRNRGKWSLTRRNLGNGMNRQGALTDVEVAEIICNFPIQILWTIFSREDGGNGDLSIDGELTSMKKLIDEHELTIPKMTNNRWERVRVLVIHNLDMRQLNVKYAQYIAFHDRLDSSKRGLSRRKTHFCAYIKGGEPCSKKAHFLGKKRDCWLCRACATRFERGLGLVPYN
jgi:hypothetical protein